MYKPDEDCIKQFTVEQIHFLASLEYIHSELLKLILLCKIDPCKVLKESDYIFYSALEYPINSNKIPSSIEFH